MLNTIRYRTHSESKIDDAVSRALVALSMEAGSTSDTSWAEVNDNRIVFIPGLMGSILVDPTRSKGKELWGSNQMDRRWRGAFEFKDEWVKLLTRNANPSVIDPVRAKASSGKKCRQRSGCLIKAKLSVAGGGLVTSEMIDPYRGFVRHLCRLVAKPTRTAPHGVQVAVFCYDWRQDLRLIADKLELALEEEFGRNRQVTIIAHSLGGLVSRYFVESRLRDRQRMVRKLITVGTPHLGAPVTYAYLREAVPPFEGLTTLAFPKRLQFRLMRAFPSIIQLLPTGRLPFLDITPDADCQFGVLTTPDYAAQRRAGIFKHSLSWTDIDEKIVGVQLRLKQSDKALNKFLKRNNIRYHLVAAHNHPTVDSICHRGGGDLDEDDLNIKEDGDGTVPTASALAEHESLSPKPYLRRSRLRSTQDHRDLFNDSRVSRLILTALIDHYPEAQFELGKAVSQAKPVVISATRLTLKRPITRAAFLELLDLELSSIKGGFKVRDIKSARERGYIVPNDGRTSHRKLKKYGLFNFISISVCKLEVGQEIGGLLVLPPLHSSVWELFVVTWNVGRENKDRFRRCSNISHAEAQLAGWLMKQKPDFHAAIRGIDIVNGGKSGWSPCNFCAMDLAYIARRFSANVALKARLHWVKPFITSTCATELSFHRGAFDLLARSGWQIDPELGKDLVPGEVLSPSPPFCEGILINDCSPFDSEEAADVDPSLFGAYISRRLAPEPTPGRFYRIRSGDTLVGVAKRAYGRDSCRGTFHCAQIINGSIYNQRFVRRSSASRYFPSGRIAFTRRFTSDPGLQAAAGNRAPSGGSFATIWIPPVGGGEPNFILACGR